MSPINRGLLLGYLRKQRHDVTKLYFYLLNSDHKHLVSKNILMRLISSLRFLAFIDKKNVFRTKVN